MFFGYPWNSWLYILYIYIRVVYARDSLLRVVCQLKSKLITYFITINHYEDLRNVLHISRTYDNFQLCFKVCYNVQAILA